MYACSSVTKDRIRWHYDLSTLFYRLLWGRHIHHGLWTGDESHRQAQEQLIESLAAAAGISAGDRVLDVGCGMGGSSIHLARRVGCQVTGITLSSVQRHWAAGVSRWERVSQRTEFRCLDAESADFPSAAFDVVWSIECTEHLFDKPGFFRWAATWLRPGGRMAICAWLAGDDSSAENRQMLGDVCAGFLCPSLGTMQDYADWMTSAGLIVTHTMDWTERVARTWEICQARVSRSGIRWLARLADRDTREFLDSFPAILGAYREGAMRYGCLVAEAPQAGGCAEKG